MSTSFSVTDVARAACSRRPPARQSRIPPRQLRREPRPDDVRVRERFSSARAFGTRCASAFARRRAASRVPHGIVPDGAHSGLARRSHCSQRTPRPRLEAGLARRPRTCDSHSDNCGHFRRTVSADILVEPQQAEALRRRLCPRRKYSMSWRGIAGRSSVVRWPCPLPRAVLSSRESEVTAGHEATPHQPTPPTSRRPARRGLGPCRRTRATSSPARCAASGDGCLR